MQMHHWHDTCIMTCILYAYIWKIGTGPAQSAIPSPFKPASEDDQDSIFKLYSAQLESALAFQVILMMHWDMCIMHWLRASDWHYTSMQVVYTLTRCTWLGMHLNAPRPWQWWHRRGWYGSPARASAASAAYSQSVGLGRGITGRMTQWGRYRDVGSGQRLGMASDKWDGL